jgi:glyoxylase-like metal-dependent hydrolase (beta-lactamase superfamily II)
VPALHWTIGGVEITRVEEAVTPVPAIALIPDFTSDQLDPHRDWAGRFFGPDDELLLSVHSFVVRSGDVTIVVDTCVGTEPERLLPGDAEFPDRLGDAIAGGLDAVDIVLCTHLHFDHVGWNLRTIDGERVPTFPNARYLFARAEVAHLDVDDHMAVRDPSVQPLLDAGLVDLVDTDHQLTPEVRLLPTPGHTPGHVSVVIESEGETALITGDMAHTPLQFAIPDLATAAFDWDSPMSTATRQRIVESHANSSTTVLGTHFAPPTSGRIRRDGDRVWFES